MTSPSFTVVVDTGDADLVTTNAGTGCVVHAGFAGRHSAGGGVPVGTTKLSNR